MIFSWITVNAQEASIENPLSEVNSLAELVGKLLDGLTQILIPFLVLFFVWIGVSFLLAQGNTEKISEAKENLLYGVIGAIIVLSAKGIQLLIEQTAKNVRGVSHIDNNTIDLIVTLVQYII